MPEGNLPSLVVEHVVVLEDWEGVTNANIFEQHEVPIFVSVAILVQGASPVCKHQVEERDPQPDNLIKEFKPWYKNVKW